MFSANIEFKEPVTKGTRPTNELHQCSDCGKQYKYKCNLKSHARIHTDEAYICEFCSKRFGRKSNYEEHRRVHTGENPFVCPYCQKSNKNRHGLKDHLKVHRVQKFNGKEEM